jgi:hypothetical protein
MRSNGYELPKKIAENTPDFPELQLLEIRPQNFIFEANENNDLAQTMNMLISIFGNIEHQFMEPIEDLYAMVKDKTNTSLLPIIREPSNILLFEVIRANMIKIFEDNRDFMDDVKYEVAIGIIQNLELIIKAVY